MTTRLGRTLSRRPRARICRSGLFWPPRGFTSLAVAQLANFQDAAMVGGPDTVTISRVPVQDASGNVSYQDVFLQFDVDSAGNLTLSAGFPAVQPSPSLITSHFVPGTYVGPANLGKGNSWSRLAAPALVPGGAPRGR